LNSGLPTGAIGDCDLLIRNAYVVSMDSERRLYPRGAVAIRGASIVAVGPERDVVARVQPRRILDARGSPVHPGFIDCHVHPSVHVARGALPDDISFEDGMSFYTNWWNALEDEDEHAGCLLASLEMLRNGTTCFVEAGTVLEPDTAARAAEAVGIRAFLADPFLWDVSALMPTAVIRRAPPDQKRALKLLGSQLWRNRDPEARVRAHVALYGIGTASEELELAAKECSDRNSTFLNQHQSYRRADVEADIARFGRHPVAHLGELGLLDTNCLFAHMNVLHDDEIPFVLESGLSIAWCPSSSMFWGIGATFRGRHAELRQRGVNIVLGSDSANSSGRFDQTRQTLLALLTARDKLQDRRSLAPEDGLEMATIAAARAIGMESQLGSLEPGKRADVVIRTGDRPEANPHSDVIQNLVFSSGSKNISTVIVDGRVVVEDGRAALVDEHWVYAEAQAAADRVARRLDIRPRMRWPIIE
jgi:cytosine/adenosine deaminase-related metal-dependent hydrolase